MKQVWKDMAAAVMMGLILPYLMLNVAWLWRCARNPTVPTTEETGETASEAGSLQIRVRKEDAVEIMDLERYLVGVVLGENRPRQVVLSSYN